MSLQNILSVLFTILLIPYSSISQCDLDNYPGNIELNNEYRSIEFTVPGMIQYSILGDNSYSIGNELMSLEFSSAFWLSGKDPAGNLKVAANQYASSANHDFSPGPILFNEPQSTEYCEYYNRAWKVTSNQIENLINNYNNGTIDQSNIPIDIWEWPARGNLNLGDFMHDSGQGMAPFFDNDQDGLYDVLRGDYPIAILDNHEMIPSQFVFTIYNDKTVHTHTQGDIMNIEVQQMDYMFDCINELNSEHAIFSHVKFINKGHEDLIDFRIGIWEDNQMGCSTNDYAGCNLNLNTTYTYNKDGVDDASCSNLNSYPTIHSQIYLNDGFINTDIKGFMCNSSSFFNVNFYEQYENILSGQWMDGTPLTQGGTGYDASSTDITRIAFPDSPLDSSGWSMQMEGLTMNDLRSVTTVVEMEQAFQPGAIISIDFIDHVYYDPTGQGLGIFTDWEDAIQELKDEYLLLKNGSISCEEISTHLEDPPQELETLVTIYPNPTIDNINIQFSQNLTGIVEIFSADGKLIIREEVVNDNWIDINTSSFSSGVYLIRFSDEIKVYQSQKFVKI